MYFIEGRDEGAAAKRAKASALRQEAKAFLEGTPSSFSEIRLSRSDDGLGYLLRDASGDPILSINTQDAATAELIHEQVLKNYQHTGSLETAVDWLMRSPWDPSLFSFNPLSSDH